VRRYLEGLSTDLILQLSNFWFGMLLLAIWGFMTLIGVVVDQGKEPAYYFTNYGPPLARLVLRLHLDNIYHSIGYIGMIGAIIACMTLATFKRVIPARMPPLLLQPLVENAVRHGVEPSLEGGAIRVRTRVRHGRAVITIANSVPASPSRPGHGMALQNVRERLRLLHDVAAQFDARRGPDAFHVQIVVPL